jgi:hypothetical protein
MKAPLFLCVLSLVAVVIAQDVPETCYDGYPRQYIAQRLQAGETITIDGRVDEAAWHKVADIGALHDIEGSTLGKEPWLGTRAWVRWDAQCLYVGAVLTEPQAWAAVLYDNGVVWKDNDFEVLLDPDGSGHTYKEFELNAAGFHWGLLMARPYVDAQRTTPPKCAAVCNGTFAGQCRTTCPEDGITRAWDLRDAAPPFRAAVHVEGALNDPRTGSAWWSLEACLPLAEYARYETSPAGRRVPPAHGDLWRANFLRVQ